jgi:hypothetical protein
MKLKNKLTTAFAGASVALALAAFLPVGYAQTTDPNIGQPESAARGSAPNTTENNSNLSTSTAPSTAGDSVAGSSGWTGANDATAGNTAVNRPNAPGAAMPPNNSGVNPNTNPPPPVR